MLSETATEDRNNPAGHIETLTHFFPELLLDLLREVLHRTEALQGVIHAFGSTVTSHANAGGLAVVSAAETQCGAPEVASERACTLSAQWLSACVSGDWPVRERMIPGAGAPFEESIPIIYRGDQIGSLVLTFADAGRWRRLQQRRVALGRELGLLLTRHDIRWRVRRSLNLDAPLLGVSQSLRKLEGEIEKVGAVAYPVILEGEFGSHDLQIASAIHFGSQRRDGPFVPMDCAYRNPVGFDRDLRSARRRASGGTLFLSAIDLLDTHSQRQLLWMIREGKTDGTGCGSVRLISSTNQSLDVLSKEGSFCRLLKAELDFLRVRIPPLRARREDIPFLLEQCFEKYSRHERKQLSPEATKACMQYDWPENELELERMVARLAVMTESGSIGLHELCRFVSWLPEKSELRMPQLEPVETEPERVPELERECERAEEDAGDGADADEPTASEKHQLGDLPVKLVAGNFDDLPSLGMGMQRALRFVGTHFVEDISLGQLAREAHVSPSHLSFLFKRALGVPFKAVLASVRIEKAQQLLTSSEQQSITDISLDVGFGDLSHFERTFKRLVGTNPREYRRRQTERRLKASGAARPVVYPGALREASKIAR